MSYILDALKKSEQERGRGSAPSVQTLHASGLTYPANKTHLWPYLLLAALFVNLAALLFFMMNRPDTDAGSQQPALATGIQPAIVAADPSPAAIAPVGSAAVMDPADGIVYKPVFMPGVARNAAMSASHEPAAGTSTAAAPQHAVAASTPANPPEMDELPLEVRQHIPAMEFSAHVYSSNPIQRSIVINGRFMEEGDYFASDLYLAEITPDGAVFDFQGQLFHKRVVSAWN